MDKFLSFLSQFPLALNILFFLLISLVLLIILFYLIAFIQGREISFWPPKIGKKVEKTKNEDHKLKNGERKSFSISEVFSDPVEDSKSVPNLDRKHVQIQPIAYKDIKRAGLSTAQIYNFILSEAQRHPVMFITSFSSLPLIYENHIVLFSWNGDQACIERLLSRNEAYPYNDVWFNCVSDYRQATVLPYRNGNGKAILHDTEIYQVLNLYKKLLRNITKLVTVSKGEITSVRNKISEFETLFSEAESSFFSENQDNGVVRLEALLSSIHKFLLACAPQALKTEFYNDSQSVSPSLKKDGNRTILLVDDHSVVRQGIGALLRSEGYNIVEAIDGKAALQAIVENDYDLVITDLTMPFINGLEVAKGVRQISPRTKIIILTMHSDLAYQGAKEGQVPQFPNETAQVDAWILKEEELGVMIDTIKKLFE
jgi:CheY-like chemotaxis protein